MTIKILIVRGMGRTAINLGKNIGKKEGPQKSATFQLMKGKTDYSAQTFFMLPRYIIGYQVAKPRQLFSELQH